MCQLQETGYTCGHVRKTLYEACDFAKRLTPVVNGRAPSFCLNGLSITHHIQFEEACGASCKEEDCNRLELRVLKPFIDRQMAVKAEFTVYAERLRSIQTCMENGKRPLYNFQQVAKEG
jgi:hypothetical protein